MACSGPGGGKSPQEEPPKPYSGISSSSKQAWEWKSVKASKDLGKKSSESGEEARSSKEQQNSSSLGLKLGKRTYFEDGHENPPSKASGAPPAAAAAAAGSSPNAKKGRGGAQAAVVPKCQVEGCKADLSGSKDYHRRHKVCEVHSKTPKNVVNGLEQRFCQQCSRFHILSEFDEGKRSCRRRLAGHNERRRKPQPDALAAYSMGNVSTFQAAYQRLGVGSSLLMDHGDALGYGGSSWRFGGSHPQLLSKHLVENLSADKLLLLLQNSKRPTGLPTIAASTTTATTTSTGSASLGKPQPDQQMKLSLSSSPGEAGGGLSPVNNESSRALSLLSADAWTKSTSSYDLSSAHPQTGTLSSSQYVLTGSPEDSKKSVHHHHHHHHHHRSQPPPEAIPISRAPQIHHQQQHQQQQQQQQNSYASLGGWKYSGNSTGY